MKKKPNNLRQEDRVKGGKRSAAQQTRDPKGKFAGKPEEPPAWTRSFSGDYRQ